MSPSPRRVVPDLYSYAPPSRLSKEQFCRDLRNYLDSQLITILDDAVIGHLFEIVKEGIFHLGLAQNVRTTKARQDRKAIGRMMKTLRGRIDGCLRVLGTYEKRNDMLLTRVVARKLKREFRLLESTLVQAQLQRRIHSQMVVMLKKNLYAGEISMAIDDYLRICVPKLASEKERDKVIGGCLHAASFYKKSKDVEDIVSSVPMQRSRGQKGYVAGQAIILGCPHCGVRYTLDELERNDGDTVRCKHCNQLFPKPFPARKSEEKK